MRRVLLCLILITRFSAFAQPEMKFQPPPPPPLDDYEELDDDGYEAGDDGFRPPPPPPLPPGATNPGANGGSNMPNPPPPPPDFRASNAAYVSAPGKFRFRLVDGEFWEKGKKRSRGRQMIGRSSGN